MHLHRYLIQCLSHKLPQKPHISCVKTPDFADPILHHRNALDTHPEGEAGDFFRIVGGLFFRSEGEDRRVHHATAQQLNPARVLAFAAALAAKEDAADLHIGARLGEGKEGGKEACLHG